MTHLKVMLAEHSGRFTAIGHETTGLVVVLPHVVFEGTPSVLGGSHLQNLSLHASNNQLRVYEFHKDRCCCCAAANLSCHLKCDLP